MKDSDNILVDTSAWIEFFRKKDPYYKVILELIDNRRGCCVGIVLAELLQGARSQREVAVLEEFMLVFDCLTFFWSAVTVLLPALTRSMHSIFSINLQTRRCPVGHFN